MNMMQTENGYLNGKLLLAMPSMSDPRFHKSVIFVCAHDENGAMGLVVNQKMQGVAFSKLLEQLGLLSDIDVSKGDINIPVMSGGPVEAQRGFVLHGADFKREETIPVNDDFAVTGTVEALKDIAQGNGPSELLFVLGYAGWSPGQLDDEIQQNAWLMLDADQDIIFGTGPDDKWDVAIKRLGIDPSMLSGEAGRA